MQLPDFHPDERWRYGSYIYDWAFTARGFVVTRSYPFIDKRGDKDVWTDELAVYPTRIQAEDAIDGIGGRRAAA